MTCDDADDVAVILKKNTDHRQVQKKKIVSVFQLRASTRDGFQQVISHAFTTTTKRRRFFVYVCTVRIKCKLKGTIRFNIQ